MLVVITSSPTITDDEKSSDADSSCLVVVLARQWYGRTTSGSCTSGTYYFIWYNRNALSRRHLCLRQRGVTERRSENIIPYFIKISISASGSGYFQDHNNRLHSRQSSISIMHCTVGGHFSRFSENFWRDLFRRYDIATTTTVTTTFIEVTCIRTRGARAWWKSPYCCERSRTKGQWGTWVYS